MAVTTAVEQLSTVEPHYTLQDGSSLTLQSFLFFFFSLSRPVKAKELEAIRIEEENAFNLDFIS